MTFRTDENNEIPSYELPPEAENWLQDWESGDTHRRESAVRRAIDWLKVGAGTVNIYVLPERLVRLLDLDPDLGNRAFSRLDGSALKSDDLDLSRLAKLTHLPDGIHLRDLWLNGCINLKTLPGQMNLGGTLSLRGSSNLLSLPGDLEAWAVDLRECPAWDLVIPDSLKAVAHHVFTDEGTIWLNDGFVEEREAAGSWLELWRQGTQESMRHAVQKASLGLLNLLPKQAVLDPEKSIEVQRFRALVKFLMTLESAFRQALFAHIGTALQGESIVLSDSYILDLPSGLMVSRLELQCCWALTAIPDRLEAGSIFAFRCEDLVFFPRTLRIKDALHLEFCPSIRAIPPVHKRSPTSMDKGLSLDCLPDGIHLGGGVSILDCDHMVSLDGPFDAHSLRLERCAELRTLPTALRVEGDLHIEGCPSLVSLPSHLSVGGNLTILDCRGWDEIIPETAEVKGELRCERFPGGIRIKQWRVSHA